MGIPEMCAMMAALSTQPQRTELKIFSATAEALESFGSLPGAWRDTRFESDRIVRESVIVTIADISCYITRTRPSTLAEVRAEAERLRQLSEGPIDAA